MNAWFEGLAALFWPSHCVNCGVLIAGSGFCEACDRLFAEREGPRCRCCDAALPSEDAPFCSCHRCLKDPPPFERAFGLFDYEGPAGEAVRAGKYRGSMESLAALGQKMALHLPQAILKDPPQAVVPLALHKHRVRLRGFSAPLILSQAVALALGKPCLRRVLQRTRDTPSQAGLSEADRQLNLRGAFMARGVSGADLLLVDDVMTTGATFRAASLALKLAGAERVRCLAAAAVARL